MPIVKTQELTVKEVLPGWKGRFIHSEAMTFGYYAVNKGAAIHEHSHANDEVWHILSGEFEISIEGNPHRVGAGEVAVIPPNHLHAVVALSDGEAMVADHPGRRSIEGVEL